MSKVYVVSTGSYSDYNVVAVFADKALAEAHADEIGGNEVEVYELVDVSPKRITIYNVSNDTYHGRGERHEWTYLSWDYDRDSYRRAEVHEYDRGSFHGIRVVGLNKAAVHKAYEDRAAAHAAREAGVA